MLKHFYTFPTVHVDGTPQCYGLLTVGKGNVVYAHSWVETVSRSDRLTVHKLDHCRANRITAEQVGHAIRAITGTEPSADALRDHMLALAHERLASRERWYALRGRRYQLTHHACQDVAMAARPDFSAVLPDLRELRTGVSAEAGLLLDDLAQPLKFDWDAWAENLPRKLTDVALQVADRGLAYFVLREDYPEGADPAHVSRWRRYVAEARDKANRQVRTPRATLDYILSRLRHRLSNLDSRQRRYWETLGDITEGLDAEAFVALPSLRQRELWATIYTTLDTLCMLRLCGFQCLPGYEAAYREYVVEDGMLLDRPLA